MQAKSEQFSEGGKATAWYSTDSAEMAPFSPDSLSIHLQLWPTTAVGLHHNAELSADFRYRYEKRLAKREPFLFDLTIGQPSRLPTLVTDDDGVRRPVLHRDHLVHGPLAHDHLAHDHGVHRSHDLGHLRDRHHDYCVAVQCWYLLEY